MKKEAVLDAAIRVLLTNNRASMNEIALAAGIGRTTLHRYFANREELIRALNEAATIDAERAIVASRIDEGPVLEAIERVVQALLPMGHRFHFLLNERQVDSSEEMQERWKHMTELFDQLMRRGQESDVLRHDLPVRWLNDALSALLYTAWESMRDGYIAPRDAPRLIMTTFLSGAALQKNAR